VQRPAEKINHALVLGGSQGIGRQQHSRSAGRHHRPDPTGAAAPTGSTATGNTTGTALVT
jgi:hypothetical protein